jgi:DNA relaxase NicK
VGTDPRDASDLYDQARKFVRKNLEGLEHVIFNGLGYEASFSRTPYRVAILRGDHGCKIYGNSHTHTILFELSGTGCDAIRDEDVARSLCALVVDRVTRIDIACDVRTVTRPSEFSNKRSHQAFRTIGYQKSDTGETCYIGSTKSDRFCRVYRYDAPHPRSETLRIEYVFRRGLAEVTTRALCDFPNFKQLAAQLGNTFGFAHRDWQPGVKTDERLRVPIVTREDENTVRWLYAQVAPALARTLASGAVELDEFIGHVYSLVEVEEV